MKWVYGYVLSCGVAVLLLWAAFAFCSCQKKATVVDSVSHSAEGPAVAETTPGPKSGAVFGANTFDEPLGIRPEYPVVVYFPFDQAGLDSRAKRALKPLVGVKGLNVAGYCCTFGTNEYNVGLGLSRALAVLDYIGSGTATSYGEERCEAACETVEDEDCAACRRVEVYP